MNFFDENLSEEMLAESKEITIEGDSFHHFKNVFRGKVGEEGKIFNGKGLVASGKVTELKKRELLFNVDNFEKYSFPENIKLILGVPKKEYFESILKSCTQMGVLEIFLIHTKFSPWTYKDHPRFQKLVESAVTQSENPFAPIVRVLENLDSLKDVADHLVLFSTETQTTDFSKPPKDSLAYFIGPEGGFHDSELETLKTFPNVSLVRLPTPIMKAETAVIYAAGLLS